MPLTFRLDPSIDRDLRDGIVALWVDVSNAGGSVGFVPPVDADAVRPELVKHLASMAEIGTTVNVVPSLPRRQEISRAPESEARPRAYRQPTVPDRPEAQSESLPNYRALRDYTLGGR